MRKSTFSKFSTSCLTLNSSEIKAGLGFVAGCIAEVSSGLHATSDAPFVPPEKSLLSLTIGIEKVGETEKRRTREGKYTFESIGFERERKKYRSNKRPKRGERKQKRKRERKREKEEKRDRLHNCKTVQAASVLSPISNLRQ